MWALKKAHRDNKCERCATLGCCRKPRQYEEGWLGRKCEYGGTVSCWWKGKQKYSFKNWERTMFMKAFYFNSICHKLKSKHPSYCPRICMFWGTRFLPLYGHPKICTSAGHRLVCLISGACLMAISKGTFPRYCKIAGKFWVGYEEEEVIPLLPELSFI
jgi:hypothetical protein